MRWIGLVLLVLLSPAAARAEPIDEDALPNGAIARLGSRQRRWRETFAHAVVDDGRTLLTVHPDLLLHYRDLLTGRLLRVQKLGDVRPDGVALSADGRVLVVDRGNLLEIWDVPAAKRIREITVQQSGLRIVPYLFRLTPDGLALLTAFAGIVQSHDVKTGARRELLHQTESIHTLAVVFGGRGVLVGEAEQVRCLDRASGVVQWARKGRFDKDATIVQPGGKFAWLPIHSPRLEPALFDLDTGWPADGQLSDTGRFWKCVAPDRRAACVREADSFSIRELAGGQVLAELPELREPLGFTPESRSLLGRDLNNYLQRWDARTGRPMFPELPTTAHLGVDFLAFAPDGRSLVSGAADGGLFRRWDLATRTPKKLLQIRDASFLHTLTLMPDGRHLLHKDKSSDLEVWELRESKQILSIDTPRPFGYQRVAMQLSSDGLTLAALFPIWDEYLTYTLRTWDAKSGDLRQKRDEPALGGYLAFSPDATLFASAMTGTHDTATGRLRASLPLDGLTVHRLLFSPDQSLLAATFKTGGVAICEVATGRVIHRLSVGNVGPIAFSSDGRRLVAGSADAITVWDAFTGRELKRWAVPGTSVLAVAPDGKTLASGHADGTILLWPMPAAASSPRLGVERDKLWADLASEDAGRAWIAAARLSDAPAEAFALLRDRLKPAAAPPEDRVKDLVRELDAPSFTRRDAAAKELARSIDLIDGLLRTADAKSPEQARRLRQLRDGPWTLTAPDRIRRWRALVVLEQIATPEAKKLLELISTGASGAIETDAAKAALRRMNK